MSASDPQQSAPDIVRAGRVGRIVSVGLVLLAAAIVALFQFYVLPLLMTMLGVAPPPRALLIVKLIAGGSAGLGMAAGYVMIAYGGKILRCGQCPPPDAWLVRDTKVQRGRTARRFAWAYIGAGILSFILFAAIALFVALRLESLLLHQPRQGVIILQQRYSGKP